MSLEDTNFVLLENAGTYRAAREIAQIGRVRALAFAGLTHDANPLYVCSKIAPPTAAAILTTPLLAKIASQLVDSGIDKKVFRFPLHLSEALEFIQPLPQEAELCLDAVAGWEAHARGAILRVVIAASENGRPIFRSVSRILMRRVRLAGEIDSPKTAEARSDILSVPEKSIPIGVDKLFSFTYEACTGIVHPIHTDDDAARAAGLRGIVIPGSATLALAANAIAAEVAEGDPVRLLSLSAVFSAPVYPGQDITLQLFERESADGRIAVGFAVRTERDGFAIRDGKAVFRESAVS